MIKAAKDYLTPKRFHIVAYVCVIVHFLCGSAFTVVTAVLRASESGKFSCFVEGQSTATYKKQVEQACFLSYDQTCNSPLPLYAFVLLSTGSTVLISVIYSLVVWKRVDEIESNHERQTDGKNDTNVLPKTLTELYEIALYYVGKKHQRNANANSSAQETFKKLQLVAFNGVKDGKLVLSAIDSMNK